MQFLNKTWHITKDGDSGALKLFQKHYSCKNKNPKIKQFVGPGEKLVLVHLNKNMEYDALFVWRKFRSANNQGGVNCAVFRNESNIKSSRMILDAEKIATKKWPNERFYTYINTLKVKSINPGYCFIVVGWKKCGFTKVNKLLILEKN